MKKLLSIHHWAHVPARVYRLLRSGHIPWRSKVLFVLPVVLYWVLPDVMPLVPVDDIVVTLMASNYFAYRMEKKYPPVHSD
ncbi:hypothetical protein [Paenibacillus senegalensis]|uniref:hypothetical protein n=1 Tax=Paenibacillus senegalensis TaxID=1465766 RepID=UPI0002886F1B|nr:hypothetical protein [Paenibacillus senegalensis]